MTDAIIRLLESPFTSRTAIIAPHRANRGVLIEGIERKIEDMERYFRINPSKCDDTEFLGLPYIDKPCVFRPGNEANTTREYARVDNKGTLILHANSIFPGEPEWINGEAKMRVIDNKFPITDKRDFATGYVYYGNHREIGGLVDRMDARGKDYVIVLSTEHIVPPKLMDFLSFAKLEQIFTKREIEDPDIGYVCVGSNNAGLPRKVIPPYVKEINPDALRECVNGDSYISSEAARSIEVILRYSNGYYEPAGEKAGASQGHPHGRVISLPILPKWVEEGYIRTEEKISRNGGESFYESLKKEGLLITEGKYFALAADPVPEFNGGQLILAKERQNIVEMNEEELKELGGLRRLGRIMEEILCNGAPSNDYMVQTFGHYREIYPHSRFILFLVPRTNVQAFLELGTKIVGLDTDPRQLAETMRNLKDYVATRI